MADKLKYHCTYCDYRFSRAPADPVQCPYCGKKGTVEVDRTDKASRLLDEVGSYTRPKY